MHRILVVDDEKLTADSLKQVFCMWGFECRAVYSTDEALVCAREFAPDLLVCDITMPHRDGLELMREVSRTHPGCKILVLTGHSCNLQRVLEQSDALPHPISVLTKPCHPEFLRMEAGAILAGRMDGMR